MLLGSMTNPFCTPLSLKIHQGVIHVNDSSTSEGGKDTLGTRIVQMALNFAMTHDLRSILILDAFFP